MPYIFLGIHVSFIFVMLVYLVSSLDDLFIDILFFIRSLYRRFFIFRKKKPIAIETLLQEPEKPIAIMFPAWQEGDVIGPCMENLLSTLDYSNFHAFIGTYPNDHHTRDEVEELVAHHPNIHQVVTPHPGPTCKADCLNAIVKEVYKFEEENKMDFAAITIQDCEDIVHPLTLKLFNYLMPRFDLVQIPIISLERAWHSLTGGHYMDEFAEVHSKEIVVRELFAGVVPGAGVGTAYSRKALDFAKEHGAEIFNTDTLTEDYEFSFRLREAGLKQIFAKIPYTRTVEKRHWLTGRIQLKTVTDIICTREYFPDQFWAAVRQKTRWTIGISLQAWRSFGWKGNWRIKYLFLRDRKMVVISHAMPLGIMVVVAYTLIFLYTRLFPDLYQPAALLPDGSPFWALVWINQTLLLYRVAHRFFWTAHYYTGKALFMLIPRYIWGILINYIAVIRATKIFISHSLTRTPIAWDKTKHKYPDEKALHIYKTRIGDLLLQRGYLSAEKLTEALEVQKKDGGVLGQILLSLGYVEEEQLVDLIGQQMRIQVKEIDPYTVPAKIIDSMPVDLAKKHQVFPVGRTKAGNLLLATTNLPDRIAVYDIESRIGQRVEFCLCLSSDMTFALKRVYGNGPIPPKDETLGQKLLSEGLISKKNLEDALKEQRKRYCPLGKALINQGKITKEAVENATKEAAKEHMTLGAYLKENGLVSHSDVEAAFTESQKSDMRIGDLLVEMNAITDEKLEKFLA